MNTKTPTILDRISNDEPDEAYLEGYREGAEHALQAIHDYAVNRGNRFSMPIDPLEMRYWGDPMRDHVIVFKMTGASLVGHECNAIFDAERSVRYRLTKMMGR